MRQPGRVLFVPRARERCFCDFAKKDVDEPVLRWYICRRSIIPKIDISGCATNWQRKMLDFSRLSADMETDGKLVNVM
jgi:hypothetical protein